jgi:hypothetical protein
MNANLAMAQRRAHKLSFSVRITPDTIGRATLRKSDELTFGPYVNDIFAYLGGRHA